MINALIHEKFQSYKFLTVDGQVFSGVIMAEDEHAYQVATNLLTPNSLTTIEKRSVESKKPSKLSAMPTGLVNVLTREKIVGLLSFVEAGANLPAHMQHEHGRK